MTTFVKLLRIIEGNATIPQALTEAMAADPILDGVVRGAMQEAASTSPNWQAIIALILQLLPVILPLL